MSKKSKVIVIGGGIAGLISAGRLAKLGYRVQLFESHQIGGKAGRLKFQGFSFDKGPSVVTMPEIIEEYYDFIGSDLHSELKLHRLDLISKNFFETAQVDFFHDAEKQKSELQSKLGVSATQWDDYLTYLERVYRNWGSMYLFNDGTLRSLLGKETLQKGKAGSHPLNLKSVDRMHRHFFQSEELVSMLNRYATYNGVDPYRAPAIYAMIVYVENVLGSYWIEGGIYALIESLANQAKRLGVEIVQERVLRIAYSGNRATGVETDSGKYTAEVIISNVDYDTTRERLLGLEPSGPFAKNREYSLSGLVFYWGMDEAFPELDYHNVFFSKDYPGEFKTLSNGGLPEDPTIYVNISSKFNRKHAPVGKVNWFVMLNVPPTGLTKKQIDLLRERTVIKLEQSLKLKLRKKILCERILSPQSLENETGAYQGSIYGRSPNSLLNILLRPKQKDSKLKNLFYAGGSVHPGGGIPLVFLSGKYATTAVTRQFR